MPGVAGALESERDEKLADVEALGPNDLAFRGFTEKVWVLSGSPTYVTKIVVDIRQRPDREEPKIVWRCPSCQDPLPNHI